MSEKRPKPSKPKLALFVLGPFVLPMIVSIAMHGSRRQEAVDEVRLLARELALAVMQPTPEPPSKPSPEPRPAAAAPASPAPQQPSPPPTPPPPSRPSLTFAGDQLEVEVANLVGARYKHDATSQDAKRFREVALAIGHGLRRAHDRRWNSGGLDKMSADDAADVLAADVRHRFASASSWSSAQLLSLQLFLMLALPGLLLANLIWIHQRAEDRRDGLIAQTEALRDERMLSEAVHWGCVLSRLLLGFLLLIGVTYVAAPLGLKSSYLLEISEQLSVPGHTSHPLWVTHITDAPVIVVGFVGFTVYALIVAAQRFFADDLDDRFLVGLLIRGVVVILLSLALAATSMNETGARLLVFIAGVFPMRALEALAKKVQVTIEPELAGYTGTFEGLPHLSTHLLSALRAAGIESTHQLASHTPADVASRVRVHPTLLGRIVDRAILVDVAGIELFKKLEANGLGGVAQLLAVGDEGIERLPDDTKQAARNVQEVLRGARVDDDVNKVRGVEAAAPPPPIAARVRALQEWLDAAKPG